jgi:hypothetical protein
MLSDGMRFAPARPSGAKGGRSPLIHEYRILEQLYFLMNLPYYDLDGTKTANGPLHSPETGEPRRIIRRKS